MFSHPRQHSGLWAISAANRQGGCFSLGGHLALSLLVHLTIIAAFFYLKENAEQDARGTPVIEIDLVCEETAGPGAALPPPIPVSKPKVSSTLPSGFRAATVRTVRPVPALTASTSTELPVPDPEPRKDSEIKALKVDGVGSLSGAGSASHPQAATAASTPPGVPGNGAAATGEGGERKEALADYSRAVRALIERHKEYPLAARRMGARGSVVVSFSLDRHGELRGVTLVKSSGSAMLDSAGMRAVRNVGKFPPPPRGIMSGEELSFRIPITFALTTV